MSVRRTTVTAALLCGLSVFAATSASAAPLRSFSVEQFNTVFEKFVGHDVRVVGRKTLYSSREVGLAKCNVRFKSKRILPKLSKDVINVQIDGRVVRDGPRCVVYINSLTPLRSDTEEFQLRQRRLNATSLEGWYELGDWATGQGKFYDDAEMTRLGREAYAAGIAVERASARGNDAGRLKKLAAQSETYGLEKSLQNSLRFEAAVLIRDQASSEEDIQQAISEAATDLPGSETPLPDLHSKLQQSYETAPLKTYESATDVERKLLHRLITADLIQAQLRLQLKPDFENGFQIADKIDRELPEYHDLAQEYREKSLKARTEQVATLSRTEITDLRDKFNAQQQQEKGREVVEAWLEHRRARLGEQDIEGKINLAEDYITMLDRPERAVELLIAADKLVPGNGRIEAKLNRLGYQLTDGKWTSERERQEQGESDVDRAMREWRPARNMTAAQLRKTMGDPIRILRIASHGQVEEFWLFGQAGHPELAVRLSRRDGHSEPKVVAFGPFK